MTDTAKLFAHGGSQAVRLPKAYRLPGTEARVRRAGTAVILEPMVPAPFAAEAFFARLDALAGGDFLAEGVPEGGEGDEAPAFG